MIIGYRRICEAIKYCKLIHVIPYVFHICMKNMGTILMYLYPFNILGIYIPPPRDFFFLSKGHVFPAGLIHVPPLHHIDQPLQSDNQPA